MPSRRRLSRIAVMQTLFAVDFSENEKTDRQAEILEQNINELGTAQVDAAFASELLQGVMERNEDIRGAIREHAPQWPLERMDKISLILLMIGTYELLHANDAPPAVVMDEAIEIAKEYGEAESAKFVNGVLNAMAHAKSE